MTLLPVVDRELRVGSRNRATYRIRFIAALIPILFSIFSLWLVRVIFHEPPISPRELFMVLTWMEFVFVAVAGFSLTCDSISQEKRDATLGLLFLTDLKGYDIVLGKLAVAGLRGLFAVIGTVPVLALPMMLGGTDIAELTRTSLSLILTLLFSMAVGVMASSLFRRSWTSLGTSGFVLLVFCLGLPLHSIFVRDYFRDTRLAHLIELPSPSYALMMSFRSAPRSGGYEEGIGTIATITLTAIVAAVFITPHVWKDRAPTRKFVSWAKNIRDLKFGTDSVRKAFRQRLLDRNPIFWLSRRERVCSPGLLFGILAAGSAAGWFASRQWVGGAWQADVLIPFIAWTICGIAVHALTLLRMSVLAVERFAEDKKSGALELTLSTPISVREILSGHWMGLRRSLAGPILIAFGIQILALHLMLNLQALNNRNPIGIGQLLQETLKHIFILPLEPNEWDLHFGALIFLGLVPVLLLDYLALAWLATWFSLRVKTALAAPILALAVLHVPPWLLFGLIAGIMDDNHIVPAHHFSEALLFYAMAGILVVTHQVICIVWSRRRLLEHFRTAATDRFQSPEATRGWWRFILRLPKVSRIALVPSARAEPKF